MSLDNMENYDKAIKDDMSDAPDKDFKRNPWARIDSSFHDRGTYELYFTMFNFNE